MCIHEGWAAVLEQLGLVGVDLVGVSDSRLFAPLIDFLWLWVSLLVDVPLHELGVVVVYSFASPSRFATPELIVLPMPR